MSDVAAVDTRTIEALFFVSDLSVARNRFVAREFSNLVWGLPAYFGGQLLIAWSLVGLP